MNDNDQTRTVQEALEDLARSFDQVDESNWGPWKLDRSNRSLYRDAPTYHVSILDLIEPEALLDQLHHLEEKTWVDNNCLGGLVRAAFAIRFAQGDPLHRQS